MSIAARPLKAKHTDIKLEKLHMVLLMMLDDFASICRENNIEWAAAFGTALGALRHGGFIPWDDDIDIVMPRSDHDKFCKIVEEQYSDKYKIVNATTCSTYPLATTRFILKGTEFRDSNLATMDFDSGIFLDLFPLDYLARSEKDFKKQAWRCWINNKLAITRDVSHPYIAGKGIKPVLLRVATKILHILLLIPGIKNIKWAQRSLMWSVKYQDVPNDYIGYFAGSNRFIAIYKVADLFPARLVEFEDIKIPVPNNVEKLLEDAYGNWQTPPPTNLRAEHYPNTLDFGKWEPEL